MEVLKHKKKRCEVIEGYPSLSSLATNRVGMPQASNAAISSVVCVCVRERERERECVCVRER